jgi:hypothetical protein
MAAERPSSALYRLPSIESEFSLLMIPSPGARRDQSFFAIRTVFILPGCAHTIFPLRYGAESQLTYCHTAAHFEHRRRPAQTTPQKSSALHDPCWEIPAKLDSSLLKKDFAPPKKNEIDFLG